MRLREILAGIVLTMLMVVPASAADPKKDQDSAVIAHIKLAGALDEAPNEDSLFGGGENLKAKLDRIKKAKKDASVKAMLLHLEGMEFGLFSFGKIEELRRAIADFRSTGKKVYCYTEEFGGLDYLIACACDVICIPEGGAFGLLGLRIEMEFYKDTLDLIKVKADFLTMGEAKGAVEPFTRTSMSPENRKQYNLVLDDLYENGIVKTIASSRMAQKLTTAQIATMIDGGPYTAKKAAALGLIDKIIYFDAIETEIKGDLKLESTHLVKNYGKEKKTDEDNPFATLMKLMSPKKKSTSKKPKIAVVYAVGAIEGGKGGGGLFGGSAVGSTTMVEAIQHAEKDDTVKAIVLRVDSPGGSALASDLIWHELKRCKKPVIASMGDMAASGGYYISMAANKIYAEPGTLTGSIGVLGGKIVLGGLFEWGGVKTETLARGKNSGAFSLNTMFSKTEREAIRNLMQDIYDQFLDKTLAGRQAAGIKMTREKLQTLAGGRIWTGRQAFEHGLVDTLGTLEDAIAEAKALAKMPKDLEPELLILPDAPSFLDRLIEGKYDSKLDGSAALAPLVKKLPELRGHLQAIEMLLNQRGQKVWLMAPYRLSVK
jgi:protease IV